MLRKRRVSRAIATAVAVCAVVGATPQAATAEVDNLWRIWAEEIDDRSSFELPFLFIVSLPVMLVTTPFWFGAWSLDRIKHSGEDTEESAD